ncbi:hypothetical protein [Parenemella sanctibonifatiensis]|nr:hypothetical protein [Parenemella sanctibonifatiensis]
MMIVQYPDTVGVCQRALRYTVPGQMTAEGALKRHASASGENTLDVLDVLINYLGQVNRADSYRAADASHRFEDLKISLHEADSAWTLTKRPRWGLVQLVDATATSAFERTRDEGGDAAWLLAQAWEATFRQQPDYLTAYARIVQSIEAVALPILSPNDASATLGKAINNLSNSAEKWTVSSLDDRGQASAATLLAILRTVWENHQRHSSNDGKAPEPPDPNETEAVLFLAVTVVQWFQRGFVRPKLGY